MAVAAAENLVAKGKHVAFIAREDRAVNGFAVDGARDAVAVLNALRDMLGIRPEMIDAWMELGCLIGDATDLRSLAAVREEIDDATARLLAGAEQIRTLAHRYRNM